MTIKIGSLFSGIGGFELGLERAIPNSETIWQCEQDAFCQKILAKHWPNAIIYDDVKTINNQVEPIDILCGGFPCQDISIAGLQRGIHEGKKSSLWWEMHRIIGILEPRIIVLENVAAIASVGGTDVIGSLAQIGYDCQWSIISASQCGAPHRRDRWFCVGYPRRINDPRQTASNTHSNGFRTQNPIFPRGQTIDAHDTEGTSNTHSQRPGQTQHWRIAQKIGQESEIQQWRPQNETPSNTHSTLVQGGRISSRTQKRYTHNSCGGGGTSFWKESQIPEPTICGMDDGIPTGLDRTTRRNNRHRLKALGNAIVPQCSQWIGEQIVKSGLIDDLLER